jgi:hypothetical protein
VSEVVTLRTGRYWVDEDGFFRGQCFEGAEQTLVDAQEQVRTQAAQAEGRKRPFLMDISLVRSLSRDARNYYTRSPEANALYSCVALVVGSPLSSAVGNFFIGINKPPMPIRVVTSETDGLAWLREQARLLSAGR